MSASISAFEDQHQRADRPATIVELAGVRLAITILATLGLLSEARAQLVYAWNNPSGGSYGSFSNWFPGVGAPPGPNYGAVQLGVNLQD